MCPAPRHGRSRGELWALMALSLALAAVRLVVKAGAQYLAGAPIRLAGWAVLWALVVVVFVPGVLLAEDAAARWGHRTRAYGVLLVAGCLLVSSGAVAICDAVGIPERFWLPPGSSLPRWVTPFLDVWVRAGAAIFVYAVHRQRLEAARALQAFEARRTEMVRRLGESRLTTARAQVRPGAFIEELRALEHAYAERPAQAENALETLIVRLRAASRGLAP